MSPRRPLDVRWFALVLGGAACTAAREDRPAAHETEVPTDTVPAPKPAPNPVPGPKPTPKPTPEPTPTDGTTDTDTTPPPPPTVEVGTGSPTFVSLVALDLVEVVHGFQGGYHVWGGARACQMLGPYHVVYTVTHEATATVLSQQIYVGLGFLPETGGCESVASLVGYLDATRLDTGLPTPVDVILDGDVLLMEMTVTDSLGVIGADARRVTAWNP